jgi:hypothetical protein
MSRYPLDPPSETLDATGPSRRQLLAMVGVTSLSGAGEVSASEDLWTSTETARQVVVSPQGSRHLASRAGIVPVGTAVGAVGPLQSGFDAGTVHALPYVTAGGTIAVARSDGTRETLLDESSPVQPATSRTRLAIGAWGGHRAVWFVDAARETIHRVDPGQRVTPIATPASGALAVLGTGGSGHDRAARLVFVGADRRLYTLAPDGTTTDVGPARADHIGVGPAVGAGSPAAIGGGDQRQVPIVDSGGDIHLVGLGETDQQLTSTGDVAVPTPLAPVDFDGDGEIEIVYRRPDGALGYVPARPADASPRRIGGGPPHTDAQTGVVGVRGPVPERKQFDGTTSHLLDVDALSGSQVSVALDGRTAIVGTPPQPTPTGTDSGSAAVFARDGDAWSRRATVAPPFGGIDFGTAVAVDGTTALVGAPLGSISAEKHSGSVAILARRQGSWSRETTVGREIARGVDRFGAAVALHGLTAVVGAPAATTDRGARTGAVHVFGREDGSWTARDSFVGGAETAQFGTAIAVDRETIVVGARRRTAVPRRAGVAVVFGRRGGQWREETRLEPPGTGRDDEFGTALALDGDTALVGAPTETNDWGANGGAVYVFARRDGRWHQQQTLRPDSVPVDGQFGTAVALDGDTAVIASAVESTAVVYRREDGIWQSKSELGPGTDRRPDWTNTAVALDGTRALLATAGTTPPATPADGVVRLFDS